MTSADRNNGEDEKVRVEPIEMGGLRHDAWLACLFVRGTAGLLADDAGEQRQ
jgi:hypothetical protein